MTSYALSPIAGAGAQFFDNNGDPLSGGKIYTYVAGTTTPQTTWTTPSGTVSNPNPIVLDAAGRPPQEVWLSQALAYKFAIKTSSDVTIATYDNIPSFPAPPIVNNASSIIYEQGNTVSAGSFVVGQTYVIASLGTTDFTSVGAASNSVGVVFVATAPGAGTGIAYVARTVQNKFQETISVKDFGAVGDGIADDTVALNNAAVSGAKNIFVPSGSYLTTSVWNIPSGVAIEMATGATVIANHSGTAIFINNNEVLQQSLTFVLDVSKSSVEWNTGADTTSIGILFSNTRYSDVFIRRAENFRRGLVLRGSNTGTTGNTFTIGSIRNNRFGLSFERVGVGGYNNQNTFIGGMLRVDSAYVNAVGYPTKLVFIENYGGGAGENALTFIGTNMEGGAVLPSMCVDIQAGAYNTFLNCRYEEQGNGTFNIASGVIGTNVIGGYDNINPSGGVIADVGINTTIIGATTSRLNGVGWKKAAAHTNPTVSVLASDGSIGFGDGAGASSPEAVFRAENAITLGMRNRYFRIASSARFGGDIVTLVDGATTVDVSGGMYFRTANTGATNVTGIAASSGIEGQIFFIRAGDANTTLVNSTNFRLTGGTNLTLASGQAVQFICTGSSSACQV